MSDLVWEDPPEESSKTGRLKRAIALLRENPGRWAKLGEYKHSACARQTMHREKKQIVDLADYEFVTRDTAFYGRYVGEESDA